MAFLVSCEKDKDKVKTRLPVVFIPAIILIVVCAGLFWVKVQGSSKKNSDRPDLRKPYPVRVGEKIYYDVRLGSITLGKAVFSQQENTEENGRALNVIVFETNLARFKDKEIIYSDPKTLLPVRIKRDVLNWFKHEKITEDYDQNNFIVTITKEGLEHSPFVITKDSPIHNAISLLHHLRNLPEIPLGEVLTVNLPSRKVIINLVGIEDVVVPAGVFKAYHLQSFPRQIEIWISADEKRIPVKLLGLGLFNYTMVLKDYKSEYPSNGDAESKS